jgi:membrane protease subunit HflC
MKIFKLFGGFVVAIVIAVLTMSVYTVDEREQALVFRFGEIIRVDTQPGIKFKMPFVNSVKFFDDRIQTMDAEPQSYLTLEKKNLIVDSFVKWRIRDVREYYVRLGGSKSRAQSRLSKRVNDAIRDEIGKRSVKDVVSGDRVLIMDTVRKAVDQEASGLGLEVVDARLKRVDLDPDINETVYNRMRAERQRVAKELRAQGEEEAEKIQANADRRRQVLLAEANRTAEKLKGEGDARATSIYAAAYSKDKEFFKFYKSLEAYQKTFNSKSDLFIVDPNSDFMQYMNRSSKN